MSLRAEPVAERSGAPRAGPRVERTAESERGRFAPPSGPRNRRPLAAVASLVVIGASVATFAGLYTSAGHRTAAVVVTRPLVQGQLITSEDLGEADVSVSGGVGFIPVTDASMIRGKRAAGPIPAGALLSMGDLATRSAVPRGDAVVGVALKDGQFPAAGLAPGQQVMVVQTGTPGSPLSAPSVASNGSSSSATAGPAIAASSPYAGASTGVLVRSAIVVSVGAPTSTAGGSYALLASVAVASSVAPDVATASSAGQVSLVLLGPGGQGGGSGS